MLIDLVDCVDEASVSKVQILIYGVCPVIFHCLCHYLVKSGVHNIYFIRTLNVCIKLSVSHKVQKLNLRLLIEFLCHFSWRHMVDVLQPLEVGAGYTTSVDQEVWGHYDSLGVENLFASECGWAVGSLENSFTFQSICVTLVNTLFNSGWNQVVALLLHEAEWVLHLDLISFWVADERAVLNKVSFRMLDIKSISLVDGSISFNNCGYFSTILLKELSCPVSYISEPLNNECFSSNAWHWIIDLVSECLDVETLSNCIVYSQSC